MNVNASSNEFGVMVSCWNGDVPLLNGCLASIRKYCPDIPICLVTHGQVQTDVYERTYGVTVLTEEQVDPRLRQWSYGYGLTKMVSFWHSPFKRFIHMDADAVMWGDIISDVPFREFDFIYNEPHEVIDDHILRSQYFDPNLYLPDFTWQGLPYFNTGCFIGRRGMFDLSEYLKLLEHQRLVPGSIFTDQGILGLMLFKGVEEGRYSAREWPLQAIVPVIPLDKLYERFHLYEGQALVNNGDCRLIHWAGSKPYIIADGPFREPMTYFRKLHQTNTRGSDSEIVLKMGELKARYLGRHDGSFGKALKSKLGYLLYKYTRYQRISNNS